MTNLKKKEGSILYSDIMVRMWIENCCYYWYECGYLKYFPNFKLLYSIVTIVFHDLTK